MKTLDRYILRQLIAVTFLGVMSLTLLMLLGQLFKELHSLLVESGAPPTIVIDFILQVIPFSLTFTVPWGFLTAVLLVYGRLAADNELTSMRMAGLSLWRLSMPAIGMGVALSALCYYINIEVAPKGKQAMSDIVMNAAMDNPRNLINASQGATKLDGIQLYTDNRSQDRLLGVHIYPLPKTGKKNPFASMGGFSAAHAQSAVIGEFDRGTRILELTLYDVTIEQKDGNGRYINMFNNKEMPLRVHIPIRTQRKMKPNRFTNAEIAAELEHWESVRPIDPKIMDRYAKAASQQRLFPCASNLWDAAYSDTKFYHSQMKTKNERAFRTEGVQRASFACACIVFSLIGVPLAITARRRDTSTGFAIGILVAALYFVALVFCETSRKSGGITPYIVLWLPNVLGIAFAIWQHAKAKYRG
ncbi:MAG: LptF/LptG family permease [Akkermansia sp.]|nr:LptF/LptG family permease [Akkermansia sp.]MDO4750598.1 LptF/LptG family permease [Akkermansia sp.]